MNDVVYRCDAVHQIARAAYESGFSGPLELADEIVAEIVASFSTPIKENSDTEMLAYMRNQRGSKKSGQPHPQKMMMPNDQKLQPLGQVQNIEDVDYPDVGYPHD